MTSPTPFPTIFYGILYISAAFFFSCLARGGHQRSRASNTPCHLVFKVDIAYIIN